MICWLNPACLLLITHMFVDSRLCFLVKSLFIFCGMLWRYEIPMVVSLKKKKLQLVAFNCTSFADAIPRFHFDSSHHQDLVFIPTPTVRKKKKSCCKSISSSDPWCIMRHKSHNQPHYVPICRPLFVTNYDVYTVYIYIYIAISIICYSLFIIYYLLYLSFIIFYLLLLS